MKVWRIVCQKLLILNIFILPQIGHIQNISLKKRIHQNVEIPNFQAELELAYGDLGDYSASPNSTLLFFEYVSYMLVKKDGSTALCHLHIGDIVSFNTEEPGDSFAIIQTIFYHQKNNHRFTFIIVDWLENTNQTMLDCPIYRLQTVANRRKIFSITLVNTINEVHFVHLCKEDCIRGNHNFRNNLYMRNLYFFKYTF